MIKHYEDDHQNVYREGIYGVVDAMEVEILALRKANVKLLDMLKWYVEEDDVNVGQEGNEYWEEGFFKAQALIKELQ